MCTGGRLVADFEAGSEAQPELPEELGEHLTTTVTGIWVVWAHKLARHVGDQFVPLTGGPGYPADARATCRRGGIRGVHHAPNPRCTCGFHALSSRRLPGLPVGRGFAALTVALSGRVLAFEWPGGGVLWRAERQTVVRIERSALFDRTESALFDRTEGVLGRRRDPGDPDARPVAVRPAAPRDSGPVRLSLPGSAPVLTVCHDDAGWCAESDTFELSPGSAALTSRELALAHPAERRDAPALV